ncbi:MAG: hypothetical protein IJ831_10160, partial [Spirochaetales bacterium]|nr:hypothetical protein [Spirochaetales bacterium]
MKKTIIILIVLSLLLLAGCTSTKNPTTVKSVSLYWTENSEAAGSFNEYLKSVTDPGSPDFIPVADRVAVFDLDGTLLCETCPWCFEYMVFADYALSSPNVDEETKKVAREIIDSAWGEKPSGMSNRQATAGAVAYKGMTMDELRTVVRTFRETPADGFTNL